MARDGAGGTKVAVVGLGSMGMGIASSLIRGGFYVAGCDVDPGRVATLIAEGGSGGDTRRCRCDCGRRGGRAPCAARLGGGTTLNESKRKFIDLHGCLARALKHKAFADYDLILIDCAPNFGLIAKNAVAASDMLLIPTRPDYLSINGIDSLGRKVQQFTQEYNEQLTEAGDNGAPLGRPPAAVVFTMVQLHDNQPIEAQRSYISRVEGLGVPTFATTMRDSKAVYGPAPEYGVPVILAGTGRALTRELRDLVSEMVTNLDEVAA